MPTVYTIYKITNKLSGKVYIGAHATEDPNDGYMGSGRAIRNAIKRYGKENFMKEVLHTFETPEEMFAKEKELVNEEFLKGNTYNMHVGGIGAPKGNNYGADTQFKSGNDHAFKKGNAASKFKRSEETRARISRAMMGNRNAKGSAPVAQ